MDHFARVNFGLEFAANCKLKNFALKGLASVLEGGAAAETLECCCALGGVCQCARTITAAFGMTRRI